MQASDFIPETVNEGTIKASGDILIDEDGEEKKEYEYVHDFEWTSDLEENAKKIIEENNELLTYQEESLIAQDRNWEKFYKFNKTNFFKDRHYILKEFEELKNDNRDEITLLDIGCGVGNSFYPLIKRKDNLKVNAFDISKRAVNMAKTHQMYDANRINLIPLDITSEELPENFTQADYAILMFVLSAIVPEKHIEVMKKIHDAMKDEGILYFRDYSLYDMAQIRFAQRKSNKVGENLYMRKDKTLAYYFKKEEIEDLFTQNGFEVVDSKCICRLIENRKDNKQMHRLWLQIKVKKIKQQETEC